MPRPFNGEKGKSLKRLKTSGSGQTRYLLGKRMKLDPYLKPFVKTNSKWIEELYLRDLKQ